MAEDLAARNYLDLAHTAHGDLFDPAAPPWSALKHLGEYLAATVVPENRGTVIGQAHLGSQVEVGEGTVIEPGAVILGPAIIGKNCTVRAGAYLRENVLVGDGAFLGNSSEFKNCILFDEAEVPHFNYVGDSVLGFRAHLGAGVILANFRLDRDLGGISIPTATGPIETGLDKFGAVIGGLLPPRRIVKVRQTLEIVERR
jgi:NDP-sugar pyrophosphorylase family protein